MEISGEELRLKIKNGDKMIIDFWAPWCGPCKMMKPMFETASRNLMEQQSGVELFTFNVEEDRELTAELNIRSVPTIKGFSDGKEMFSEVGVKPTNVIMEMPKKLL
jgi:thioredoxin 2